MAKKNTPNPTAKGATRKIALSSPAKAKTPKAPQTSVAKGKSQADALLKKRAAAKAAVKKSSPPKSSVKKIPVTKVQTSKASAKKILTGKTPAQKAPAVKAQGPKTPLKKSPAAKAPVKKVSAVKIHTPNAPVKKTPLRKEILQKLAGQRASMSAKPGAPLGSKKVEAKKVALKKAAPAKPAPPVVESFQPTGLYGGIHVAHDVRPFPAKTPYSKAELEKLYDSLREERERLLNQLASLNGASMDAINGAKEHPGYSIHIAEHASDLQAAEANMGVRSIEEERLEEVEQALDRIKNSENHYGLCMACGSKIGIQRLIARPHAHLCMPCRKRYETIRSRRGF
jgi:RNA polymerase-binding transcription factor DksA